MIRFTVEDLAERCWGRSESYADELLRHTSFLPDGTMQISEADDARIGGQYLITRVLTQPPSTAHVVRVLARRHPEALAAWQSAGQPLRDSDQHASLKRLCDRCSDAHCRAHCVATPILRWLATASPVAPHCLWPKPALQPACKGLE